MKIPLFLLIFFSTMFISNDANAQIDKWRLESKVCDDTETYHCCCYTPHGLYLYCKNCPVPSYQIICNLGGIWGCWGLSGCEAGGLSPSECEICCFGGYAGGGDPHDPNAPIPFGMI